MALPSSSAIPQEDMHDVENFSGSDSASTSPTLSRSPSYAGSLTNSDDWDFPPLDKLTVFDFLDQFTLPAQLEKINRRIQLQSETLKKHRDKVKLQYVKHKQTVLKKTDVELEKYKDKFSQGLDKLVDKWGDTKVISTREKLAFVVGVCNIFITGILIGGYP